MEKEPKRPISEKEFREKQSEKIVGFLSRAGIYEYAEKLKQNNKDIEKPTFDTFKDILIRVNGILRDIPPTKRGFDGENVRLVGHVGDELMPKHEDKEGILKEAYEAINKLPNEGDETYLLPAVINAIHLFADGNGRTSRVLHTLLASNSQEEFNKQLPLAVSERGRYDTTNISPGIVGAEIEKIVLVKHGIQFEDDGQYSPVFPDSFGLLFATIEKVSTAKAKEFFALQNSDTEYCFVAAYGYLKEKKLLEENTIQLGKNTSFSPSKMEKNLSEADWDAIIQKYYGLKKEHVETLIDAFVEPDVYKNLDGSMNLRSYFIQKIQKESERNKK